MLIAFLLRIATVVSSWPLLMRWLCVEVKLDIGSDLSYYASISCIQKFKQMEKYEQFT
jgi:hypothetical protein